MQILRLSRPGGLYYIQTLLSFFYTSRSPSSAPLMAVGRYLASRLSNRRIRPMAIVSWCLIPCEKVES